MKYTDNLNLKKPEKGEVYLIEDFNDNADIVDETIKNLLNDLENNNYGYLPLVGGEMSGSIYFQSGALSSTNNDSYKETWLSGDKDFAKGAVLLLLSKDSPNKNAGYFELHAKDGANTSALVGKPDGTLQWDGGDVITHKGGTINGASLTMANGAGIVGNKNSWTYIAADDSWDSGARLSLYGTNNADANRKGSFSLRTFDANGDIIELIGRPDGKLTWGGTSLIRDAGWIDMFAGDTPPAGWLACNGAAVSRTTYAKLFAAIGTTYGSGDGSTTFNLPNIQNGKILNDDNDRIAVYGDGYPMTMHGYKDVNGGVLSEEWYDTLLSAHPTYSNQVRVGRNFSAEAWLGLAKKSDKYSSHVYADLSASVVSVKYCIKY